VSLRRIEVVFYGLFMKADFLRANGATALNIGQARVPGFAFRGTPTYLYRRYSVNSRTKSYVANHPGAFQPEGTVHAQRGFY
jgi:hypothetical protein